MELARPPDKQRLLGSSLVLRSVLMVVLVVCSITTSAPASLRQQLPSNTASGRNCSNVIAMALTGRSMDHGDGNSECAGPVAEGSLPLDDTAPRSGWENAAIVAVSLEFVPESEQLYSIAMETAGDDPSNHDNKTTIFTGVVNNSSTLNLKVVLQKPSTKLWGVRKVKIYSVPPGRCLKATLWICYDPVNENMDKFDQRSQHHLSDVERSPSRGISTSSDKSLQKSQLNHGDRLSSYDSRLILHRIQKRRAVGVAAHNNNDGVGVGGDRDSNTTPRTYGWIPTAWAGCIALLSMAVLPSLFIALLCCNKKKSELRKTDKKLIVDEASPFTQTNNPMNAPSMSSLDNKLGECSGSSADALDVRRSVYDLATPTVSTFHSVYSNANSLTNLLDSPSVDSNPNRAPPPPQETTPSSSSSISSHKKLTRVSKQIQTDEPDSKSPLTPPSSDAVAPVPLLPTSVVIPLDPPPPPKQRTTKPDVTMVTDVPSSNSGSEELAETSCTTFTTFKAVRKPIVEPSTAQRSHKTVSMCSSVGSESLVSYVLTAEMLAGGQRSRSGTCDSYRSLSSTFSSEGAASPSITSKRTSTCSNLQQSHQQFLSPTAAKGRGNRNSLCGEQQLHESASCDGLVSSSAIVEVGQSYPSGLIHSMSKEDKEFVSRTPPLKLRKHFKIEQQNRPFSLTDSYPHDRTSAVFKDDPASASGQHTGENKYTSLQVALKQLISPSVENESSKLDESTLDRGLRSRQGSVGVVQSREGSLIIDDSFDLTPLNSPSTVSPPTRNVKKVKRFKKRKPVSPPHTPPPPPSSLPPGPPTFPSLSPIPPPPSTLPPGPPVFPFAPPIPPPPSTLPPGPPVFPFAPPIPPPPSTLPPGPPTYPSTPPTPPPPSTLPPGPPTFLSTSPTPPSPLFLSPGPPALPFRPSRLSTGCAVKVEQNSNARFSLLSDLDNSEVVRSKPSDDEGPICVSCGIRIEEYPTAGQRAKEPTYLCILPDGDHNSCPNIIDRVDVDSHSTRPFHRRSKKFLRKENSVPSYHVLEPGKLICIDCLNRDGPIYHELESFHSDSELLDSHAPPIPPRRRAPRQKDPIYERVSSIHRNQAHALRLSMSSEEGSYITAVGRKPRSLHLGSSSDYESVQSQTNTSPFFHPNVSAQQLAAKFEQKNKQSEPLPSLPPPPLPPHRNRPHPPPLAKLRGPMNNSNSSHDYESVSSFEHGALKRKVSDHDYARIGPAPSMESLDEPLSSPPYVPDGATRAKLLKIDSQGYATVIPSGDLEDDEVDCLQFSDGEQCPVDPSQMVCREEVDESWRSHRENGYAPLTPQRRSGSVKKSDEVLEDVDEDVTEQEDLMSPRSTTPQDYEVPMNILQQSPNRNSSVVSPRLTRQRAVASASDTETKRLSCASDSDDRVEGEEHKGDEEERDEELEAKVDVLVVSEEVFVDSGLETSVDSQNASQTSNAKEASETSRENRNGLSVDKDNTVAGNTRPRSMTVVPVVAQCHVGEVECFSRSPPQVRGSSGSVSLHERQTSMPSLAQPKSLHISLDQNRQVIV